MILKCDKIADLLDKSESAKNPLVIIPTPNIEDLRNSGDASVDLRLGTWFVTTKARRHHILDVYDKQGKQPSEHDLTDKYYIPFGKPFILHPRSFVLAVTLEWVRMPSNLAGYINGKSSWGRRGLVIETAPGVHPGFSGCLTMEMTNVGEIPIAIYPGIKISQLFLHKVSGNDNCSKSSFVCRRQPILGEIKIDSFAENLINKTK